MRTVKYTLAGIEYEGPVPDTIERKHITAPIGAHGEKIPQGARMSLTSACLGVVHARAWRVGDEQPDASKARPDPRYGTLRSHGFCPYTYGDAVERHFVIGQEVEADEFWTAAHACFGAVLGRVTAAQEVKDAKGFSKGTRKPGSASASASPTGSDPTSTSETTTRSSGSSDSPSGS